MTYRMDELARANYEHSVEILDGGQRVTVARREKHGGNWRTNTVSRKWEESLDELIHRAYEAIPL